MAISTAAEPAERILTITRVFDAPRAGVQGMDPTRASRALVGAARFQLADMPARPASRRSLPLSDEVANGRYRLVAWRRSRNR